MNKFSLIILCYISLFIFGCSSSEETQKEGETKKEEVYVFDEIPTDTLIVSKQDKENEQTTPPAKEAGLFYVQIGAFATEEKANEFAASSRKLLEKELIVTFSKEASLYVVRLQPFQSKLEADSARDEVKKFKEFKDAFVVVPQ